MTHRTSHGRWFAAPLLLVGLVCGCGDSPPASSASSSPPPRAVRVEVVTPREVADSLRVPGLVEAAARIERVLTADPGTGVMRHADAGYELAIEVAKKKGLDLPGITDR